MIKRLRLLVTGITILPLVVFAQQATPSITPDVSQPVPPPQGEMRTSEMPPPTQPPMPPHREAQDKQRVPMPQGDRMPPRAENHGEEFDQRDYIDPRELADTFRQIRENRREAQRLLKRASKMTGVEQAVSALQTLLAELTKHENLIKNAEAGSQREVIQDFHELRGWDVIEAARIQIELPQEIKQTEKELKRVEKLMASKTFKVSGINLDSIRAHLTTIRESLENAKKAASEGNAEEAREAMQTIYEGSHPGEIYGLLQQLREMDRNLKRIKSQEIKDAVLELLGPVYEAINEGDYREANMALNEISRELFNYLGRIQRQSRFGDDMKKKFDEFERKLENKLEGNQTDQPPYTQRQQGASVLDAVRDFFVR